MLKRIKELLADGTLPETIAAMIHKKHGGKETYTTILKIVYLVENEYMGISDDAYIGKTVGWGSC